MKVCSKCKIEKELSGFTKSKRYKDGYHYFCKDCKNEKSRLDYNKENKKTYYLNNKEKILEMRKEYYTNNKEEKLEYQSYYYSSNKSNINQKNKIRRKNDIIYHSITNVRNTIKKAIKKAGYTKKSKAFKILGCSYQEFKIYIENQFEAWMSWNNNGNYTGNYNETWQYDHIMPISSAITEDEILKLSHYTNFRPLCSRKNLEKSDKF
jgi:hypothetical protein